MSASLNGVDPGVVQAHQLAVAIYRYVTGGVYPDPVVTSGVRTFAQQTQLYADAALNPYPVNRPGDSAHEYGLAIDSWVDPNSQVQLIDGETVNAQDLWVWCRQYVGFRVALQSNGASKDDPVHGEVPNWRQIVAQNGLVPAGMVSLGALGVPLA